jgi:hypothetical protein
MTKLKTKLKWSYLRWKLFLNVKSSNKRELTAQEAFIKNVVIKLASNPNNSILVSPISKSVYIQTETGEYTLMLEEFKIKITNHQLFIENSIDEYFSKELFRIIYRYIEKNKSNINKTMFKDEMEGFNYMLNQLK